MSICWICGRDQKTLGVHAVELGSDMLIQYELKKELNLKELYVCYICCKLIKNLKQEDNK